jgi:serine/threonine protein kinase
MIVDQTLWNTSATTAPGTFRWKAPELMDPANPQNTASAQTDVYAFAMTSLVSLGDNLFQHLLIISQELFTGKPPFYPEYSNDGMVLLAVVHGRKTPSRPATDALHDLLWKQWERCWNNDPSQRPSMSQLAG